MGIGRTGLDGKTVKRIDNTCFDTGWVRTLVR